MDADSSAILEGRVSDGDGKRDCSNFAWMRRYDRDRGRKLPGIVDDLYEIQGVAELAAITPEAPRRNRVY